MIIVRLISACTEQKKIEDNSYFGKRLIVSCFVKFSWFIVDTANKDRESVRGTRMPSVAVARERFAFDFNLSWCIPLHLSPSLLQVISLSCDFFLASFSFSLCPPRSSLSFFLYSLSFDFSPSFCPCLPNAITCGCYRAENTTTDQLCPEDVEREELTIRQFKSTVPIPTVTPITIFHITHGRRNKGSYTATLR